MWSCRDSLKNWCSFQILAATKGKQRHEGCQPALCNLWARACCASDFEGRQHIPQLWMPKPSGVSAGEKPSQDKADVLQQISLESCSHSSNIASAAPGWSGEEIFLSQTNF